LKKSLKVISLVLGTCILFTGCSGKKAYDEEEPNISYEPLFEDLKQNNPPADANLLSDTRYSIADFGLSMLQYSINSNDTNPMVSPISILSALGMLSNAAVGETRDDMETAMQMTVPELNSYLYSYIQSLPTTENNFHLANGIWWNSDSTADLNQEFLQTIYDYYGPNIYARIFDENTEDAINSFVNENTLGMIPEIIDGVDPYAPMVLVNALAFEGSWEIGYNENNVEYGRSFTNLDETTTTVTMLYMTENRYITMDNAQGFIKYYAGDEYAFVALLPNEGVDFNQFVSGLSGESLITAIESALYKNVRTALPKFTSEYTILLNEPLVALGMGSIFGSPDFSGMMVDGNEFNTPIDGVIHKTYIDINEDGTRAAASTAIVDAPTGGIVVEEARVILNRPFVYAIIDTATCTPLFLGTVTGL